jgi:hypothetical protein
MADHPFLRVLILGIALWGLACSEPKIDAGDLERSSAQVRRTLDKQHQRAFDNALDLVREVERGRVPGTDAVEIDGRAPRGCAGRGGGPGEARGCASCRPGAG